MSAERSESFKKNYTALRDIAQRLNDQNELDIDQLVPMVEQATKAYKACKTRISEVERLLAEKIVDDDQPEESS